jgi:hypothetical protein
MEMLFVSSLLYYMFNAFSTYLLGCFKLSHNFLGFWAFLLIEGLLRRPRAKIGIKAEAALGS